MEDFLISGKAHVYYALLLIVGVGLAIVFGANPSLAAIAAALAGMVFVDLYVHGYSH